MISRRFHELTPDERAEWRQQETTQAAIKWLADLLSAAHDEMVAYGRNPAAPDAMVRLAIGRHDMAERVFIGIQRENA